MIKLLRLKDDTLTRIKAELRTLLLHFPLWKQWDGFKRGCTKMADDECSRRLTTVTITDNIEKIEKKWYFKNGELK